MRYHIQHNIGKAKYCLSYHDGKQRNPDGSDFYGIKLFSNKRELEKEIKYLESLGYTREPF